MAEPLGVAVIGCGTVGTGVVKILTEQSGRLEQRSGRSIQLRRVVVRDPAKARGVTLPSGILGTDVAAAVRDPSVHVVIELMGGTTTAKQVVLDALSAGKHVITANKALLADAGAEVFAAARAAERAVCFEAAVAGGVPIIRALAESLTANQVTSIQAILNGTSNFILTAMADGGRSYAEALVEAQKLGYAEADPTLDVDGSDAAHKLAVLAQIAFGVAARPHEIERQGIDHIEAMDIRFAGELGYTIKLLAEAWASPAAGRNSTVALHVAPVMVRKTDMLAQVRGAYNAIQVIGDVVGETLYQGPGAGMMPTASSVVADLIDLAVGRAQKSFAAAKLWSGADRGFSIEPSEKVRSRFYLRLLVRDQPGVLADVCRALADEHISISSVIQHEAREDHPDQLVPLVIMTHYAATGHFRAAVKMIDTHPALGGKAVSYPVDD
ncbi:MAG: homoserine dehydrogenase [Fimbriiglobus sp.]|jgi:homoserine dehydrogenase|nr:homoserine dehydrogenase [Fimbriiglobus sp.]